MATGDLAGIVSRLENVASRLEKVASKSSGAPEPAPGPSAAFVDAFDELIETALKQFSAQTAKVGGDVVEQVKMVEAGFQKQKEFLIVASKSKEPGPSVLRNLLKPISEIMTNVSDFRDKRRGHAQFNFFSVLSEGIPALGWVTIAKKPAPYVKQIAEAAQFYANRIIKDFKGKKEDCVQWAKAFMTVLTELQNYVQKFHTTGLSWNPSGPVASAPSAAPGPPPPGPPPPPVVPLDEAPAKGSGASKPDMSGLFASLNKGSGVTSGLKHVAKDQMTHKNPSLRASSIVKAADTPASAAAKKPTIAAKVKRDPVFRLDGKKWVIEYQENKRGSEQLVVAETNMSQSVYAYRCVNVTIVVKGRVNNVTLDNCKKCAVVIDKCISGLDMINSQSIQAQIMGSVPTVNVDKTDGCQVFLSKDCLTAEIVSAKSSEMNVMIPKGDDGDFDEFPLPEQYRSKWNGKAMQTEPTDIAG
eukprot:m.306422 g.306422  ORF g.306422 m.306422 type:complete len:471 (+) comp41225_c0_seq1:130-1542(+)